MLGDICYLGARARMALGADTARADTVGGLQLVMKDPIREEITRRLTARGQELNEESYTAELVALTVAGLTRTDSSDLENELAVGFIETIAPGIGSNDPKMTRADRRKVPPRLLAGFRSGQLQLVSSGNTWMVIRRAQGAQEGVVVVWQGDK
jgi:hypothetical protein